jgi:hypothetical protein
MTVHAVTSTMLLQFTGAGSRQPMATLITLDSDDRCGLVLQRFERYTLNDAIFYSFVLAFALSV